MTPAVYIIVLNYLSWRDTIECLESLLEQDYTNYKIVIVDNGSLNDSVFQLESWALNTAAPKGISCNRLSYRDGQFIEHEMHDNSLIHFIRSEHNGGYAAGNNIGIRYSNLQSKDHFLWLLNNDTIVFKDTLTTLTGFFNSNIARNVGLVGCLQLFYHDPSRIQCTYGRYNKTTGLPEQIGENQPLSIPIVINQEDIHYLSGACLLTHSHVLEKVGLLSEDYFLFFEELDMAYRMKKAGYTLLFCNDTHILHKHGTSIDGKSQKGSEASSLGNYHHFRSKFIFARKHHKGMLPLYLFISALQVGNRLIKGRFKNASAAIKGMTAGIGYHKMTMTQR